MKIFKVLSVMMIVALSAGFASCSNDDDKNIDATNLIGTWQATYSEGWYKDTNAPEDNETWNGAWKDTNDSSQMPTTLTFNKDGKGTYQLEVKQHPFTWSVDGDNLLFSIVDEDGPRTLLLKISSQSATQVVVEQSYENGSKRGYEKTTYTRVK